MGELLAAAGAGRGRHGDGRARLRRAGGGGLRPAQRHPLWAGAGEEPLHRPDVHRPRPGAAGPRRAAQAEPAPRRHQGAAAGRRRRLDRAGHDHPGHGAACSARPARPRSTCGSPRRRTAGRATTASTPGPARELIAANLEVGEICEYLGADSLAYLALDASEGGDRRAARRVLRRLPDRQLPRRRARRPVARGPAALLESPVGASRWSTAPERAQDRRTRGLTYAGAGRRHRRRRPGRRGHAGSGGLDRRPARRCSEPSAASAGCSPLPGGYREPVLVASSTDGVGTKMAVATALGRFDTVGIDLVAMCVDDLVCCGARPLFFLDYQLLGRVDPDQVRAVMTGIAEGCRQAGCAIVGGELAEHPGLLAPGEVDVAGFAVGIVERDRLLDGPARTPWPATCSSGCPRRGCAPTATPWPAGPCSSVAGRALDEPAWAGATDDPGRRAPPAVGHLHAGHPGPPRRRRGPRRGPHHRRRPARQPAPGSAPRRRRRRRAGELGRAADVRRDSAGRRNLRRGDAPGVQPGCRHGRGRARRSAAMAASVARSGGHEAVLIGRLAPGSGVVRLV